jgi:hypothetical protein
MPFMSATSVLVLGGVVLVGVMIVVMTLVKRFVLPQNEEERERVVRETPLPDASSHLG